MPAVTKSKAYQTGDITVVGKPFKIYIYDDETNKPIPERDVYIRNSNGDFEIVIKTDKDGYICGLPRDSYEVLVIEGNSHHAIEM